MKFNFLKLFFLQCLALPGLDISPRAFLKAVEHHCSTLFSHQGCLTIDIFLSSFCISPMEEGVVNYKQRVLSHKFGIVTLLKMERYHNTVLSVPSVGRN